MKFPNGKRSMGHNWYIWSYRVSNILQHNAFYKVGRMFQQIFHIFSHHYLNSPKCNQTEIQNLLAFHLSKRMNPSLQFFGSSKWLEISNDKVHLRRKRLWQPPIKLRFNGHSLPIRLNLAFVLLVLCGIDIPSTVRKRPQDIGSIDHLLQKHFIST